MRSPIASKIAETRTKSARRRLRLDLPARRAPRTETKPLRRLSLTCRRRFLGTAKDLCRELEHCVRPHGAIGYREDVTKPECRERAKQREQKSRNSLLRCAKVRISYHLAPRQRRPPIDWFRLFAAVVQRSSPSPRLPSPRPRPMPAEHLVRQRK